MNHRNNQSANITAGRDGQPKQCRGRAPHALRSLIIKELKMANRRKCLSDAMQSVLRDKPEDRDGDHGQRFVEEVVSSSDMLALELNEAGDEGSEDRDEEANGHAVEKRDATVEASEAAGERDEYTVIEGDGEKHGEHGEDRHRARGDLEGGGEEVAVHGAGLLEGEGALLGGGSDDKDAGRPDRGHADKGFELFYAVDCAEFPWVWDLVVFLDFCRLFFGDYGCFVQEPERDV